MPKESYWCDHIIKDKYGDYRFERGESQYIIPDFWGQCPVKDCNAPRPSEPSLVERLGEHLSNISKAASWEELAQAAISFLEKEKGR